MRAVLVLAAIILSRTYPRALYVGYSQLMSNVLAFWRAAYETTEEEFHRLAASNEDVLEIMTAALSEPEKAELSRWLQSREWSSKAQTTTGRGDEDGGACRSRRPWVRH